MPEPSTTTKAICDICHREFGAKGIGSHRRKCVRDKEETDRLAALAAAERERGYDSIGFIAFAGATSLPTRGAEALEPANRSIPAQPVGPRGTQGDACLLSTDFPIAPDAVDAQAGGMEPVRDLSPPPMDHNGAHPPQINAADNEMDQLGRSAEEDDIRVEVHPRSGKPTKYYSYEDYSNLSAQPPPEPTFNAPPSHQERDGRTPWFPFASRIDFELAEWMHDLRLNAKEMDRLLKIISDIRGGSSGASRFNLSSAAHVRKLWKIASESDDVALVKKPLDGLEYDGKPFPLDVWVRPLWSWCLELVDNPEIVTQFQWDAQQLSRHDGSKFVRFFNEPWTGKAWWKLQDKLPRDAYPICLILYADKTKLSTFGTVKGYPVYVRCANLPAALRNGKGLAGGRLVGWLPILPEEQDKKKKTAFINFKRIVWHKSVAKLMESIAVYTKEGFLHKCGDGLWRRLFPIILILSADYEEMCMMAATRGHGSACPCPVCLVPITGLMDLSTPFEMRTTESMQAALAAAQAERLAVDSEYILKKLGLRAVDNSFWALRFTDIYLALCWDRLHAYHSGVFKHLLIEYLDIFEDLPRQARAAIEDALSNFPRWRDLNHFTEVAKFREFSDGRKYEDLSKVIIFASHHVFLQQDNAVAYQLLKWMRSYLEMDMYSSLRSHSDVTIGMGRSELRVFENEMKEYVRLTPSEKDWNFPKIHTHAHLFDDIENKGVTVNFNTKFNENLHGDVKNIFHDLSNFKNIDEIIARVMAEHVMCMTIREKVSAYDRKHSELAAESIASALVSSSDGHPSSNPSNPSTTLPAPSTTPDDSSNPPSGTVSTSTVPIQTDDSGLGRFKVGSSIKGLSLTDIKRHIAETYHPALNDLRTKLNRRLTHKFGRRIQLAEENTQVTLHRYVSVDFTSLEDSQSATDILRMNDDFHTRERYDCALVAVTGGYIVCRLIGIFEMVYDHQKVLLALVLPFDEPVVGLTAEERKHDRDLRFTRVRARPATKSTFVPIEAIVRGALVVPDESSTSGRDYIIMDVVDADFWLRMRLDNLALSLKQRANI